VQRRIHPRSANLGPTTAIDHSRPRPPAEDLFLLVIRTHWIRVGIVTAYGALSVWMPAQNAWLARAPCFATTVPR
jgi:hypothetical protein